MLQSYCFFLKYASILCDFGDFLVSVIARLEKQRTNYSFFLQFSVSERDVVWLQCHGERIYVLDLTVLTEDKRLVVTAVLLHYLSVGLFEPCTQFRL